MTEVAEEAVRVHNPADFLHDQVGVFEVMSPSGYISHVTCRRGTQIRIRTLSEPRSTEEYREAYWRIRRLSAPAA